MGEVIIMPVVSTIDQPAERILQEAIKTGMKHVVIVGYDDDGKEYFASSYADGGDALWALQRASLRLLRIAD